MANVPVTPGSGANIATNAITRDAVQEQFQLVQIADLAGANVLAVDASGRITVNVNGSVPVTGTFYPATQPVSIATLPALAAGSAAIGSVAVTSLPALAAGSAAIGSVTVSNFPGTQPVSGTVAVSNPTAVGSVTAAGTGGSLAQAVQGIAGGVPQPVSGTVALGAGSAAVGSVTVTALPALPAGSNTIGAVTLPAIGGAFTAMVTPSTNGTLLTAGANGVRFYLPTGTSISYTIAASAPSTAPTLVTTITPATVGPTFDENVASGAAIYVTAVTGSPFYRTM